MLIACVASVKPRVMTLQSSVNFPKIGLKRASNSGKYCKQRVLRAVFALLTRPVLLWHARGAYCGVEGGAANSRTDARVRACGSSLFPQTCGKDRLWSPLTSARRSISRDDWRSRGGLHCLRDVGLSRPCLHLTERRDVSCPAFGCPA